MLNNANINTGLPIEKDKDVRDIQNSVETCKNNLKTRRINFAQGDIKNVKALLDKNGDNMLKQVSPKKLKLATESLARMKVILVNFYCFSAPLHRIMMYLFFFFDSEDRRTLPPFVS